VVVVVVVVVVVLGDKVEGFGQQLAMLGNAN